MRLVHRHMYRSPSMILLAGSLASRVATPALRGGGCEHSFSNEHVTHSPKTEPTFICLVFPGRVQRLLELLYMHVPLATRRDTAIALQQFLPRNLVFLLPVLAPSRP